MSNCECAPRCGFFRKHGQAAPVGWQGYLVNTHCLGPYQHDCELKAYWLDPMPQPRPTR